MVKLLSKEAMGIYFSMVLGLCIMMWMSMSIEYNRWIGLGLVGALWAGFLLNKLRPSGYWVIPELILVVGSTLVAAYLTYLVFWPLTAVTIVALVMFSILSVGWPSGANPDFVEDAKDNDEFAKKKAE